MQTVAIFSDVHGNSAALWAVLADIQRRGADQTFSLGDLVGYGPDPNGVIDLIRDNGIPSLMGNYDDGIGFERGNCGCFYPDAEASRIGVASYDFTVRSVTPERKDFLRALPTELRLEIESIKLHLVHGSPRRINEYLLPDREQRTFERIAAAEEADVLVFGHTHTPWHRLYGRVLFVNVGSAGKPKTGDPRACYTLLHVGRVQSGAEGGAPEVQVEDIRVDYGVESVAAQIIEVGLPPELAEALRKAH
jgi:putative phosphoesterase